MRPRSLAAGALAGLIALAGPSVTAGAATKHRPAHRLVQEPVVVLRHVKGVTSFVVGYELNRVDETHVEDRVDPRASVKIRTSGGEVVAEAGQAPYYLRSPWSRCYTLDVPAVAQPGAGLDGVRAGIRVRVDITDRRGRRYGRTARVLADRHGRASPGALSRRLGCRGRYPTEASRGAAPLDPNSPACAVTKDGFPAACVYQY